MTGDSPNSFVVNSLEKNPISVDGIPVIELDSVEKDTFLIIAVTELVHNLYFMYHHNDLVIRHVEKRIYV